MDNLDINSELQRTFELSTIYNPDPNHPLSIDIVVEETAEFIAEFMKYQRTKAREETCRKTNDECVDNLLDEIGDVLFTLTTAIRSVGGNDTEALTRIIRRVNDKNEAKLHKCGRLPVDYLHKRGLQ